MRICYLIAEDFNAKIVYTVAMWQGDTVLDIVARVDGDCFVSVRIIADTV